MEKYTEVFYWGSDTTGQFGVGDRSMGKTYSSPKCCSFSIPIKKISCGDEHSGFIAANGYVYTMGSNKQGRLGINNPSQKFASRPILIESLVDYQIIDLSCGTSHSGAISTSGVLFTWGNGTHGALGFNELECAWLPTKVSTVACRSISCGGRHSAAVTDSSSLLLWGSSDAGQLGLGHRNLQRLPAQSQLSDVVQVSSGVFHTLALLATGEVYAAGGNSFGQLGLGTKESSSSFVLLKTLENKEVVKVSAGQHSACLTAGGELYVWGTGPFGEILTPTKMPCAAKLVDVSVGVGSGLGVDRSGMVWAWGSNSSGSLGTGDLESKAQPFPVMELQSKVVTQVACGNGFVIALGKDVDSSRVKMSQEVSPSNQQLLSCLDEMKKEISRLQKGTGGLEELNYKLEQSKIKQNHLQSMYLEEQRERQRMEAVIKDAEEQRFRMKEEVETAGRELEGCNAFIKRLESELEMKSLMIEELRRENEKVLNEKAGLSEDKKRVEELNGFIKQLQQDILRKTEEIEQIKSNTEGIASHNNVLEQEIKDIPVLLKRINSLETLLADKEKETEHLTQEVMKYQQKTNELSGRIKETQVELERKNSEKIELLAKSENLLIEKTRSFELTSTIQQLEKKLREAEHENYLKIEGYCKEISVLNDSSLAFKAEVEHYKEKCNDFDRTNKKLKSELEVCYKRIEQIESSKKDLESKLNQLNSKNQEILFGLQKELNTRAETFKSLNLSFKSKSSKGFQEEEDISSIYGRP